MIRWWLATQADQVRTRWAQRFDPRWWTVDFPRPMLASVTTLGADGLAVDLLFQRRSDLAGLIWESADRWSHPLLAYETRRDYRGTRLSFRWQAAGVMPLDAVNGPTLTIEGRDAAGQPRTWYVRLSNYAAGAPDDARIALDFDDLAGGFLHPAEADPVWAGDIDRLFISLVAPGYAADATPLAAPLAGRVTLTELRCEGPGAMLRAGDAFLPPHALRIASGYDDSYNQTPERLVEQWLALGYRGLVDHYAGMSHAPALRWNAAAGAFLADTAPPVAGPAQAWHADFFARLKALNFDPVVSVSFELLDEHCPADWAQRDAAGGRALTGYTPPSTLLSPANADATAWLGGYATGLLGLAVAAGLRPRLQVGEPWWWIAGGTRPCLYDAATLARAAADGVAAPRIADIGAVATQAERAWLDYCSGLLGAAVLALRDRARALWPEAQTLLLLYTPQIFARPETPRLNLPAAWAAPAFDVLQLEDYEYVTAGASATARRARQAVRDRYGYAPEAEQYFAGFAATAADWPAIAAAANAMADEAAERFVWAWPQVARDGFTAFTIAGEEPVPAFHDVRFPLELGYGASGGPQFATQVVVTGSGHEQRNAQWADALLHYDAGIGVRSEADLAALIAFFRARRGQAHAFRFRDPLDHASGDPVTPFDQAIGIGDGATARFALIKTYGEGDDRQRRRITRPEPGSVRVAIAGVEQGSGWQLEELGWIAFDEAPPAGAEVTAGFAFDVPVRFGADRIDASVAAWRAGELPSAPLVEVREG